MYNTDVVGLALNVFNDATEDNPDNWKFSIYLDTSEGIDSGSFMTFIPTDDQLSRYLQISQDDDWWVGNRDSDFNYILLDR